MKITEEQILKIVDKCFHSYASSFRNEARQEAIYLINKHKQAINYSQCCVNHQSKEVQNIEVAQKDRKETFNLEAEQLVCSGCKGSGLTTDKDDMCEYCDGTGTN